MLLTFPLLFLWSCYFFIQCYLSYLFCTSFSLCYFCKIEHLFTFCPYPSLLVSLCCLFSLPSLHCACCSYVNILLSLYLIILDFFFPPPHIMLAMVNFQLHFYKARRLCLPVALATATDDSHNFEMDRTRRREEKRIKVLHAVCVDTAYPAYCNKCTFC